MLTHALVERRVDALIIVSAPGDSSYLQADIDHRLVVVAVDRPLSGVDVDTLTIDNRGAPAPRWPSWSPRATGGSQSSASTRGCGP